MKWKPYISVFFLLVFLGKFLSVDSALPHLFFGAEKITYIKPFCEKRNAQSSGDTFEDFYSESSSNTGITFVEVCNPLFQFEFPQWEKSLLISNFLPPQHKTSTLIPVYGDRFYPPPKA